MEDAVRARTEARSKLASFRASATVPPSSRELRVSLQRERHRLIQNRFQAGLAVVKLALNGETICDFPERGNGRPPHEHISTELDTLFQECVHRPTRYARGRLTQRDVANRGVYQKKVQQVVSTCWNDFVRVADRSVAGLIACSADIQAHDHAHLCFRATALTALACLSDMERYVGRPLRARVYMRLAQAIDPGARGPHLKLALLAWQHIATDNDLLPMFHFSAELAETTPRSLASFPMVSEFVSHIEKEAARKHSRRKGAVSLRGEFSETFILCIWNLLSKQDEAALPSDAVLLALSSQFRACFDTQFSVSDPVLLGEDLHCVVGILMFARHRLSPQGDPCGSLQPGRARKLDYLIRSIVLVLCHRVSRELGEILSIVRARRKNRVRSLQKKRKLNGNLSKPACAAPVALANLDSIESGLNLFGAILDKLPVVSALGPLSILSHFWSKSLVISAECDLVPYKELLDALVDVDRAVGKLAEFRGVTDMFGEVSSSVMEFAQRKLPALYEDVWFAHFVPCQSRQMFRRVQRFKINVSALVQGVPPTAPTCVANAVEALEDPGYEELAYGPARRHLEVFAQRITRHAYDIVPELPGKAKAASCLLTSIALRAHRIGRLRRRLAEHGGGRIPRLIEERQSEGIDQTGGADGRRSREARAEGGGRVDQNVEDEESHRGSTPLSPRKRRKLAAVVSQQYPADACTTPPGKGHTASNRTSPREQSQTRTPCTPVCLGQVPYPSPSQTRGSPPRAVRVPAGAMLRTAVQSVLYGAACVDACDRAGTPSLARWRDTAFHRSRQGHE